MKHLEPADQILSVIALIPLGRKVRAKSPAAGTNNSHDGLIGLNLTVLSIALT